jgi:DUF4097 and DUF4098 domain-containing protein YvlB
MKQTVSILAFAAAAALAAPLAAQDRTSSRTPQTDRTIPVARGVRLNVTNDIGEVVIRAWDRDAVRVQAVHATRTTIDVQTAANIVTVRSRPGGPSRAVDYEISVPSWIAVRVSGEAIYIGVEGVQNEVSAETVRGDIVIRGGSGTITAKSIQGEIIVENWKGRITAGSVNEAIRITGASGEISAETTNGDITLTKVEARMLDVATVNGDLQYEGSIPRGGQFKFATHNGDVTMIVPEDTGATFSVRMYNGDFQSNLPTKAVGEIRRGRRATYTLGGGGAEVDVETFGGTIRLRRPGTGPRPRGKDDKGKERDAPIQSARSATAGSTRAARSAGDVAAKIAVSISKPAIVMKLHGSHGAI